MHRGAAWPSVFDMNKRILSLRRPLIAFAGSLGVAIASMILFGVPGICGMVGGILPTLFPSLEFLDILGILGLLGGMLGALLSVIWFIAAVIVRLHESRHRTAEQ